MTQTAGDAGGTGRTENNPHIIKAGNGGTLSVPDAAFIENAEISRDGQDLILTAPDGAVIVIEGYFSAEPQPMIASPEGLTLTPQLVQSFVHHAGPVQLAQAGGTLDDASPVGTVKEVSGEATVTRTDGTVVTITAETVIYQGDVVETSATGAVNIVFVDESTFSISNNARLAIDEYVFDPQSQGGESNFSMLRGVFIYTSGMIGREDPDDVQISTPTGSIGIRGTIIAGNVNTGEYTVVEGAIVLRALNGDEITLDTQYQTAKFDSGTVVSAGTTDAESLGQNFSTLNAVEPGFFSTLQDSSTDSSTPENGTTAPAESGDQPTDVPATDDSTLNTFSDQPIVADSFSETSAFTDSSVFSEATDSGTTAQESTTLTTTTSETLAASTDSSIAPTSADATATDTAATTAFATSTSTTTPPPPPPVNDFAPVIGNDGAAFAVSENSAVGTTVGSVAATDADGNPLTYSIIAGNTGNVFSIDSTGAIKVNGPIDFETLNSYSLTTSISDGIYTTNATYSINIGNANDAPVLSPISPTLPSISEDATGSTGGSISTLVGSSISDADSGTVTAIAITGIDNANGTWQYSTDSGTTWNSVPAVSATNALLLDGAGKIRFIPNANYNGTASFSYKGWDMSAGTSGGTADTTAGNAFSSASDTAGITVNPVNDAPTLSAATFTIAENSPGGAGVGTVTTASDIDGDTLTFSETGGGTGAGLFEISASGAITVQAGAFLDFEATPSYTYEISVSDGVAAAVSVMMTINISDVLNETFAGTTGNDTLTGSSGNDTISGLDGNDTLIGGLGSDNLSGGLGDDTFVAASGDGNDTIDGGSQTTFDIYDASSLTANITATLGASGNGTITDGINTDTLFGIEEILTGTGSDVFNITDTTYAYAINGAAGVDMLDLSALAAGNSITASLLTGTIAISGGTTISVTAVENLRGTVGADYITGDSGNNALYGMGGNDTFIATSGTDSYDGGTGIDTLDFSSATGIININLFGGLINNGGFGNGGTVTGVENVIGTAFNDTIAGNNDANNLTGGSGDDTLHGLDGNDTLSGDAGNDTLTGGLGNDTLDGGVGIDTVSYASAAAGVQIDLGSGIFSDGDGGTDTLLNIENVTGSSFNDILRGDTGANVLQGGAGDDLLKGSGNTDTLDGGTGIDTADYSMYGFANNVSVTLNSANTANLSSAAGTNTLIGIENIVGSQGADTISGSTDSAANVINGYIGNDTLSGGNNDTLIGGDGDDVLTYDGGGSAAFSLQGGNGADTININGPLSMAGNGNASVITGGNSPGHNDILRFSTGGAINLNPDGIEDFIKEVEIFDFMTNSLANTIAIDFRGFMVDFNLGNLLTIKIDDSDSLMLNFSGFNYHVVSGDIDLRSGANYVEFKENNGVNTVRIEYTTNVGATGNITVNGLGATGPLSLNGIIAGVNSMDGFAATDNLGLGFSHSLSAMGDMDGDGFDDVLITRAQGPADNGTTFAILGQSANPGNIVAGSMMLDSGLFNDPSASASDISDMRVSSIGDFDGDGIDDYIVGAPLANDVAATTPFTGNAQIIDGATGLAIASLTGLVSPDAVGKAVAGIGDVNGDGYADVLVGAPYAGASHTGAAYLLFGGATTPTAIDVTAMSPLDGIMITGIGTQNLLGMNMSAAGDFNNDGIGDFVLSAPREAGTGEAYIIMGDKALASIDLATSPNVIKITGINVDHTTPAESEIPVFSMGDLNGDGGSDIAIAHTAGAGRLDFFWGVGSAGGGDNVADFSIVPGAGFEISGGSAAGDFNGDGRDDIVVVLQSIASPQNADIYVVFGDDTLSGTVDKTFLDDPSKAFHMTYTIPVGADPNTFDFAISAAGDLNGDGFYDIVIGLPDLDTTPGVNSDAVGGTEDDSDGAAIAVYGRDTGGNNILHTPAATADAQVLVGGTGVNNLSDGGFIDTSFRGGAGDDVIHLSNGNFNDIDGGGGLLDTISIDSGGMIDFSSFMREDIQRIEALHLNTGQSMTLTLQNVFSMMQTSDDGTLTITAAGGNTLTIDDMGAGNVTAASAAQVGTALGADSVVDNGGASWGFYFGGNVLTIDSSLFVSNSVNIV